MGNMVRRLQLTFGYTEELSANKPEGQPQQLENQLQDITYQPQDRPQDQSNQ